MNYEVRNRQFNSALLLAVTVDGASVQADYDVQGLDNGLYIATIKKAVNVFTLKLNKALGRPPIVLTQAITLDCVVRPTIGTSLTEVELTSYTLAGANGTGDEDFTVYLFGTEEIVEGGR